MKRAKAIGRLGHVTLEGGPWHGLLLAVRPANTSEDPRMSLPINVKGTRGRYCLRTGKWEAL